MEIIFNSNQKNSICFQIKIQFLNSQFITYKIIEFKLLKNTISCLNCLNIKRLELSNY